MKKWQLKPTSHYRFYGANYPSTIGRVDPDAVDDDGNVVRFTVDAKENPDPQHFEEVKPVDPVPPAKPAAKTTPITETSEEAK